MANQQSGKCPGSSAPSRNGTGRKLLQHAWDALLAEGFVEPVAQRYVCWMRDYVLFHNKRHPQENRGTRGAGFFGGCAILAANRGTCGSSRRYSVPVRGGAPKALAARGAGRAEPERDESMGWQAEGGVPEPSLRMIRQTLSRRRDHQRARGVGRVDRAGIEDERHLGTRGCSDVRAVKEIGRVCCGSRVSSQVLDFIHGKEEGRFDGWLVCARAGFLRGYGRLLPSKSQPIPRPTA